MLMNKILAPIACIMAVAMLSACGSQDVPDEPAPPDYSGYTDIDKISEPNGSEENAGIIGVASLSQGVNFKGTLDNKYVIINGSPNLSLDEDYYKIELMNGETITITASNASNTSAPFRVKFYGPCHRPTLGCTEKIIDVVGQTLSFKETIKAGDFQGSDTYDTRNPFYIKVSNITDDSQGFFVYSSTSYAITVKLGQ